MDTSSLEQLAQQVWPLIGGGAAAQVGARGVDEAFGRLQDVLARIGRSRRERGLDELPADIDELRSELARFAAQEPDGEETLSAITNIVLGPIHAKNVNFGIVNRA
jgi:hypothetical protein